MKKVIDIEERIPSMRERRRRRANRKFTFVVAIFLIALLFILYFQSSFSKIGKLTVIGANIHEPSYYLEKSGIQEGEGLWSFSKKKVSEQLIEVEGIQEVEVSRKWFHDVELTVVEWRPIAYIEDDGRFGLLLENGEVFTPEQLTPEEDAPILNGFSDAEVQSRLTTELKKMENNIYQLISEVIYTGTEAEPNLITVFMDDGYEVKVLIPSFAEKMTYYPDIIAQLNGAEKGVIDMEVGTYFTPYSQVYGLEEVVEMEETETDTETEEGEIKEEDEESE